MSTLRVLVLVLGLCVGARPVAGQTPQEPRAATPVADEWSVHVFLSGSADLNFNSPPSDLNTFHIFDYKANQLVFDVAEVSFGRRASRRGELGFRVDASVGETEPMITAAAGLFRDATTGQAGHVDLPQVYLRYIAPVGQGLQIDVGKFLAPLGLESIESWDTVMDNASRSLLYGYATPDTLTGVRVLYPISSVVSAQGFVTQGWDRVVANNDGHTYGGQLIVTPTPRLAIDLGAITGPEQAHDTRDVRTALDLILVWQATPVTKVSLNVDEGREAHATPAGTLGNWHGYAAYLRHDLSPRVALALRGEIFHDVDGARTGLAQQLGEVTVTPDVRVRRWLTVRSELRVDRSTAPAFDGSSGPRRTQVTAAVNALVVF